MANLQIDNDTITVRLTALEKAESVHGDITVPRSAVTGVWVVPDGMAEVPGMKLAGAGFPGVIKVGLWVGDGVKTFAVCHGAKPAVVLQLTGQRWDRIVATVDNPDETVRALS